MSLSIRKAASEDFDEVYKLICELVGTPVGAISYSSLKEIYQANLLSDIKGQYLAELSDEIVGFISLTFDMRLSEGGKVAVIDELVVKEKQRSNGIGSALVEYAIKLAKSYRCCMVEVATNLRREDTHRFYEKKGFVKNGYRFGFDDL
jgi:PhnO protein